jgi:hypothetical protein
LIPKDKARAVRVENVQCMASLFVSGTIQGHDAAVETDARRRAMGRDVRTPGGVPTAPEAAAYATQRR